MLFGFCFGRLAEERVEPVSTRLARRPPGVLADFRLSREPFGALESETPDFLPVGVFEILFMLPSSMGALEDKSLML